MGFIGLKKQWSKYQIHTWSWRHHSFKNYDQYKEWYDRVSDQYWHILKKSGKMSFAYHAEDIFLLRGNYTSTRILVGHENMNEALAFKPLFPPRYALPDDPHIFPTIGYEYHGENNTSRLIRHGSYIVYAKSKMKEIDREMGLKIGFTGYIADKLATNIRRSLKYEIQMTHRLFCIYFKPLKRDILPI